MQALAAFLRGLLQRVPLEHRKHHAESEADQRTLQSDRHARFYPTGLFRGVEMLRSRTVFYFELAQDLRKAKTEEIEQGFYDLRLVTFVVAGIFTLGGLLLLLLPKPGKD